MVYLTNIIADNQKVYIKNNKKNEKKKENTAATVLIQLFLLKEPPFQTVNKKIAERNESLQI